MNKIRIFSGLTLLVENNLAVIILLILMLLPVSCRIDGDRTPDRTKFTFKTGDDTELFFKNIRQSDYDLEINEAAKLNIFRHENRPEADSGTWLMPAIVVNYLQDEAYILIEPSDRLADMEMWEIVASDDTLRLSSPGRDNNLEFATRIYEYLNKGDSLMVRTPDGYFPFLYIRKDAEAFRITMSDYYRLTRVF